MEIRPDSSQPIQNQASEPSDKTKKVQLHKFLIKNEICEQQLASLSARITKIKGMNWFEKLWANLFGNLEDINQLESQYSRLQMSLIQQSRPATIDFDSQSEWRQIASQFNHLNSKDLKIINKNIDAIYRFLVIHPDEEIDISQVERLKNPIKDFIDTNPANPKSERLKKFVNSLEKYIEEFKIRQFDHLLARTSPENTLGPLALFLKESVQDGFTGPYTKERMFIENYKKEFDLLSLDILHFIYNNFFNNKDHHPEFFRLMRDKNFINSLNTTISDQSHFESIKSNLLKIRNAFDKPVNNLIDLIISYKNAEMTLINENKKSNFVDYQY